MVVNLHQLYRTLHILQVILDTFLKEFRSVFLQMFLTIMSLFS